MNKQFPVSGVADLDKFLAAFPKKLATKAYRRALTAAADPIEKEARLRAPKKSGKMAKAIKKGSPRKNQDGTFSISVRMTGRDAFLGLFAEYGVEPHLIARKGGRRGRAALKAAKGQGDNSGGVLKIGDEFVSGIISHPGYAASPFLRPALDLRAEDAIAAFAASLRASIEEMSGYVAPVGMAA